MKIVLRISLFLSFFWLAGQRPAPKFTHLTLEDGLSQSSVTCSLKDSQGFMWFGTEDGLNKYDGAEFTIYRPIPSDLKSLSNGSINAIVEQGEGVFWIGTDNGLNYFDAYKEEFRRYVQPMGDPASQQRNRITALQLVGKDRLLVGTMNGLYDFDRKRGFKKCPPFSDREKHRILDLYHDPAGYLWVYSADSLDKVAFKDGNFGEIQLQKTLQLSFHGAIVQDAASLWLGTRKGLLQFDLGSGQIKNHKFYESSDVHDTRNSVLSMVQGKEGTLWLGTGSGGLVCLNKKTGVFQTYVTDPKEDTSINSNSIKSLLIDDDGILWVGTYGGGVNKYDGGGPSFDHFKSFSSQEFGLSENTVRSVLLDSENTLWVGTHGGLDRLDRDSGQRRPEYGNWDRIATSNSNTVRALCQDSFGTVWAGTWLNGLIRYDKDRKEAKRLFRLPGRQDSIGQVRALIADNSGNIWIGARGAWKFNPRTEEHQSYTHNPEDAGSLSSNAVNVMYFDKGGALWIGTQQGLNRIDLPSGSVQRYLLDPEKDTSLSNNYVTSIAEDSEGFLWIGTYGGGLNVLDRSTGRFKRYNTENGLLNDVIYGVLIDQNDVVWFTSNSGLASLNSKNEKITYFGDIHGVQGEEFNASAYFKSEEGEFFFGGINGLNAFHPDRIRNSQKVKKIAFTDFQLLNEKGLKGNPPKLDKHISQTEQIRLSYRQNTFSLKFSELNYSSTSSNDYQYWLAGLDNDWQELGREREITLANLRPGNYRLHVRVKDEAINRASLRIAISNPPWRSNWAYSSYVGAFFFFLAFGYRYDRKIRKTKQKFEDRIRDLENDLKATLLPADQETSETVLPLKKVGVVSRNQKFLERAVEVVERHLEDSDFDVEVFVNEMYMSRSQLHRKLKSLTGCATTEFIRLIRLKRAAQLLRGNSGTVAEIAFKVGFENVAYFSKCFKDTFGVPPSQYPSGR